MGDADLGKGKRRRDDETEETIVSYDAFGVGYVDSNDVIDLVFYENSYANGYVCPPEYTHQVFDRERIDFLSQPATARISVNVCTSDLSTFVGFHQDVTDEEQTQLLTHLEKALPKDYGVLPGYSFETHAPQKIRRTQSDPMQSKLTDTSFSPPGHCIHEFSLIPKGSDQEEHYEIYLATYRDKGAAQLLHRAEKLAMWFIETADGIDFSDDRWEVLFLFKRRASSSSSGASNPNSNSKQQYFFVGYFTLFTFRNVLAGFKLRICQALILPSHQQRGLGKELVFATYRLAQQREEYKEVTVEDPAPAFERLRDICDCEWAAMYLNADAENNNNGLSNKGSGSSNAIRSLSSMSMDSNTTTDSSSSSLGSLGQTGPGHHHSSSTVDVVELNEGRIFYSNPVACARELKLTPAQGAFVVDCVRYCYLPDNPRSHVILEQHKDFVEFRNEVKKRLLRENPDFRQLEKEKKFKKLEELFQELLERFKLVRKHWLRAKKAKGGGRV